MQLTQEQLIALTGYKTPADIVLCLDNNKVRYFIGKRGRVWTTQEALNSALGLVHPILEEKKRQIKFR